MRPLLLFCLVCCLWTCHPGVKQDVASGKGTTSAVPEVLSDKNIYNTDSVKAALRLSGVAGALQGKKIFLKAMDLYRNQKNAAGSIELFQKSIRIWPDAKSYYELGNALMDANDCDQSLKAYSIADFLEFVPASMLLYNTACAYSRLLDTALALQYLEGALNEGYSNKKQLLDDPDLDNIRNTTGFRAAVLYKFKDELSLQQIQFRSFLENFPELGNTFSVRKEEAGVYSLKNVLSYDFADFIPGMEDGRFSRDVSNEYQPIGKKVLKNGSVLVAYSAIQVIADTMLPVSTYLLTFDSLGKSQDTLLFSCFCDPQKITSGTLDDNEVLTITEYQPQWKQDPLENGYKENAIVKYNQVKLEKRRLGVNGKFTILEDALPVSARKD